MGKKTAEPKGIAQYDNWNLYMGLLKPENLSPLEGLLAAESEKLGRLKQLDERGELDFGDMVDDEEEMNTLCRVLQREVESYLGTPQFPDATCCCYDDGGDPVTRTVYVGGDILIPPQGRVKAIPELVHELTHHILHSNYPEHDGFLQADGKAFNEGLARGVERRLSQKYASKEGNEAFEYVATDVTVGELRSVYRFLCSLLGKECREELLAVEASNDYDEARKGKPSHWAIGTANYALREMEHGEELYREAFNGDF